MKSAPYAEQLLSGIYQIRNYGITERRTKQYDTDILKTLKSIDASLKSIAKSVQPVNTTVVIDNNSEEAVKEFLNSLHRKNVQREDAGC